MKMLFDELMPFTPTNDGVIFMVKVTANASKTRFGKLIQQSEGRPIIKLYIAAPPVEGKANQEIIEFLSKSWGIPKSRITIIHGQTHSLKKVHILENSSVSVSSSSLKENLQSSQQLIDHLKGVMYQKISF